MLKESLFPKSVDLEGVRVFVEQYIAICSRNMMRAKLRSLTLESILITKNPFLIKVGGAITAGEFVEREIENSLRASEEEILSDSLRKILQFFGKKLANGKESRQNEVDSLFKSEQSCWKLLCGRNEMDEEVLVTLSNLCQNHREKLQKLRAQKVNSLTQEFLRQFGNNGLIDHGKLILRCRKLNGVEKVLH